MLNDADSEYVIEQVTKKDLWTYLKLMKQKNVIENNDYGLSKPLKSGRKRKLHITYFNIFLDCSLVFVKIVKENKIAGFICIAPYFYNDVEDKKKHSYEYDKSMIWFNLFGIHRNKGLVSKFLPELLKNYKESDSAMDIIATVKKDNTHSSHVLIKNGFEFYAENTLSNYYRFKI